MYKHRIDSEKLPLSSPHSKQFHDSKMRRIALSFLIFSLLFLLAFPQRISFARFHPDALQPRDKVTGLPMANGEAEPESYAGYIKVREWKAENTTNFASLFYWFFPAEEPKKQDSPLIIWLQGGPGSSSMTGLFLENGPLWVDHNVLLHRRNSTWSRHYSMLFIDQPVGTGYSYLNKSLGSLNENFTTDYKHALTDDEFGQPEYSKEGYVMNQEAVANDLLVFMDKFYELHPEQRSRPLYITGESYGGKYVPSFSYAIHRRNEQIKSSNGPQEHLIPLAGLAVGNGLTDPLTQVPTHGPHAYYLGLVSPEQRDLIQSLTDQVVSHIQAQDFLAARNARNKMFGVFANATGNVNWYDVRRVDQINKRPMLAFLKKPETLQLLHLEGGKKSFGSDNAVKEEMRFDICKSAARYVELLLQSNHYKVLLYQGAFDYRDGVASNTDWIRALKHDGAEEYKRTDAARKLWIGPNGNLAGYAAKGGKLERVIILCAGHYAPLDQPENALDMITRFIEGYEY
ncbi:uncharacterized protein VTP21DRAFT_2796 [Calcarisporiella thermophila]|uniref:uncharacterized protein n=1 Tax=Calcarisporiella thermophila TaxID=911321 RepID=UPI0037424700